MTKNEREKKEKQNRKRRNQAIHPSQREFQEIARANCSVHKASRTQAAFDRWRVV